MAYEDLQGWLVDIPEVYGAAGMRQAETWGFHHLLCPAPRHDAAVLFYACGEVGVGKEVGRLAVLEQREAPQVVYRAPGLFWLLGIGPARYSEDGRYGFVFECEEVAGVLGGNPKGWTSRLVVLDFQRRRTGRDADESKGFDIPDPDERRALLWRAWD